MYHPVVDRQTEDREALFRRTMAGVTDQAWNLGVDTDVLAALHDVLDTARQHQEAGEGVGGCLPQ